LKSALGGSRYFVVPKKYSTVLIFVDEEIVAAFSPYNRVCFNRKIFDSGALVYNLLYWNKLVHATVVIIADSENVVLRLCAVVLSNEDLK
jgi:hypothetical protein